MPPRESSLMELAVENVGLLRASHALSCLAAWCIARHKVGPGMDVEGYQAWWKLSRSQAYRDQATIRKAFPGVDPEKVYERFMADYRSEVARREAKADRKAAIRAADGLAMMRLQGMI